MTAAVEELAGSRRRVWRWWSFSGDSQKNFQEVWMDRD